MAKKRKPGYGQDFFVYIGVTVVIIFMAAVVFVRSRTLGETEKEYLRAEESVDSEIEAENRRKNELEEEREYVDSPEWIQEMARKIFGLVMPDEIILRPEDEG